VDCVAAVQDGDASTEQTAVVNWLFQHQLLQPPAAWETWYVDYQKLHEVIPDPQKVIALTDGSGEDERVHIRGSHRNLGALVPRRAPLVIAGEDQPAIAEGSGRLDLADQLVQPSNPLLARVIVNRLWHHLMGRGIVASVDDFGAMGQMPSHPELLDWMARDLQQNGWSLKHAIRQIVRSQAYQISSERRLAEVEAADPNNQLWHRAMVRRLTAETLRDSILTCSGQLDRTIHGPSIPVHLTDFMTGRGRPESGPLDGNGRRSIYTRVQRNFLSPMMLAFDMPAPFSTMGRRSVSNVPAQSLILMNDPFIWQQANSWAAAICQQYAGPDQRLDAVYMAALGYRPDATQRQLIHQFAKQQAELHGCPIGDVRVWADICHAVWNTKEFVYRF
jgi:hypothetical protein